MKTNQIDEYRVIYYGKHPGKHHAVVILLNNKGRVVGHLFFHADPTAVPGDTAGHDVISQHFAMTSFSQVIDLLRNESPIYHKFGQWGEVSRAWLSTSKEPIGEGEL